MQSRKNFKKKLTSRYFLEKSQKQRDTNIAREKRQIVYKDTTIRLTTV